VEREVGGGGGTQIQFRSKKIKELVARDLATRISAVAEKRRGWCVVVGGRKRLIKTDFMATGKFSHSHQHHNTTSLHLTCFDK
jgi:hypothetical protein